MNIKEIDKELEKEYDASKTDFLVNPKSVSRTINTSAIRLLSKDYELYNDNQLFCMRCQLDSVEYGLLFDLEVMKGFTVKIVRKNGQIKEVRDLDAIHEDEEWQVITAYFNSFEVRLGRILKWYKNKLIPKKFLYDVPQNILKTINDKSDLSPAQMAEYVKTIKEIHDRHKLNI